MDQFEGLLNFIRVIFCTWITRMKYAVSTQNRWLDSDWYKILIPVKSLKSLELILGPTSIESGNQTKKYEWVWTRKLSLAKMMFPLLSWSGFSLSATWIIFYFHAMMQRFYVNRSLCINKTVVCVILLILSRWWIMISRYAVSKIPSIFFFPPKFNWLFWQSTSPHPTNHFTVGWLFDMGSLLN